MTELINITAILDIAFNSCIWEQNTNGEIFCARGFAQGISPTNTDGVIVGNGRALASLALALIKT